MHSQVEGNREAEVLPLLLLPHSPVLAPPGSKTMATMLCALVERWRYGNRSLLHREDFVFETQVGRSSRSKGFEDPSQFPFLGFKDRNLESRYLDDLVKVSKTRIGLGYGISLLLVTIMPFTYTMGSVVPLHVLGALPRYGDRDIWLPTLALAVFVIGLAASIGLYRFKRHQAVLFVTEATFLSYIVVMGYYFSKATEGWTSLFSSSGWGFHLAFMEFPAFLTLFFWNLPFVLTAEIIGLAFAVLMVIVPLVAGFWDNDYQLDVIQEQIEVRPDSPKESLSLLPSFLTFFSTFSH